MHTEPTEPTSIIRPLERIVDDLLAYEGHSDLDPEDQGAMIIDQFVGALIRKGTITGSQTEYGPRETLASIDAVTKASLKGMEGAALYMTSADGLRAASLKLFHDSRTGQQMSEGVEKLLHYDKEGRIILGSMNQIEGYLFSDESANDRPMMHGWQAMIIQQLHTSIDSNDPYHDPLSEDNRGFSDNAFIREHGREWGSALRAAAEAGIDMDLVRRSAERLRGRRKSSLAISTTALSILELPVSGALKEASARREFDRLFDVDDESV